MPCNSWEGLFDQLLELQGKRVLVLGATSGDTGSAAIEACRDRPGIDIVILYPKGRVSAIQRRQMTTVESANVHAVAVEGTFDDCQDLVKAAFGDAAVRRRLALAAVNSINWTRIVAQIAYYLWVGHRIGRPVSFSVPTGNFGNVLAGWAARRMGGPVETTAGGQQPQPRTGPSHLRRSPTHRRSAFHSCPGHGYPDPLQPGEIPV